MKHVSILSLALFLLSLLTIGGCAKKGAAPIVSPDKKLAVVGFSNPQNSWELLAGCLPEGCTPVKHKVVAQLDALLQDALNERKIAYTSPAISRKCEEIVQYQKQLGPQRKAAFHYWMDVGECIPADYLLVPQILYFQDREGSEWGASTPAGVIMDIYLLDITNQSVAGRYHFDETQQPLMDNVLEAGKFFERKMQWVTGLEMAKEAIDTSLTELGL